MAFYKAYGVFKKFLLIKNKQIMPKIKKYKNCNYIL